MILLVMNIDGITSK